MVGKESSRVRCLVIVEKTSEAEANSTRKNVEEESLRRSWRVGWFRSTNNLAIFARCQGSPPGNMREKTTSLPRVEEYMCSGQTAVDEAAVYAMGRG